MSIHRTFTTSVKITETSGIDVGGLGSLLSGIGTVLGAVAVLVAALVGTNTFNAWRRQQLLQKKIDLSESILSASFRARAAIAAVRAAKTTSAERMQAIEDGKSLGVDLSSTSGDYADRVKLSLIVQSRIRKYNDLWIELEELKARGWAYFGDNIRSGLHTITSQVDYLNESTDAYLQGYLSEEDRIRHGVNLNSLTLGEKLGQTDHIRESVAGAVKTVQEELQPFLQEQASQVNALLERYLQAIRRFDVFGNFF